MPTGARSHSADPSAAVGWTSVQPVPLPFEQLLRPDGGGRPVHHAPPAIGLPPAMARRMIARDAVRVLLAASGTVVPGPWLRPGFAARVERTRGDLAPIASHAALAASFAREAMHSRPPSPASHAVRAAYALRWLELVDRVPLPAAQAAPPAR